MRRNRDRRNARKRALITTLVDNGLFPTDPVERRRLELLDPYELRRKGLDEPLTEFEFGRAIFHLNQRRGFKSNRKTDGADKDTSVMKDAIREVRERLEAEGFRTVGEWLAARHERGEWVKARRMPAEKGPDGYALYVDRQMIADEFNLLWDAQERLRGEVGSPGARDALYTVLFTQRPLKPVDPGRCTLEPTKRRAPKALPSVQRLRIYQESNNLKYGLDQHHLNSLDLDARDTVAEGLLAHKHRTFVQIRKSLDFDSNIVFNLEGGKRDRLLGNLTEFLLREPEHFGPEWDDLELSSKDDLVLRLLEAEDSAEVITWLTSEYSLSDARAEAVASVNFTSGYSNLCLDATRKVLAELESDVIVYSDAVTRAGYKSHSALNANQVTGELLAQLPYYGEALERHVGFGSGDPDDHPEKRFGKIANPTVHIALNEVRKVVNELITEYGHPTQAVVEVTRDLKNSPKVKKDIERDQKLKQVENEQFRELLKTVGISDPSRQDLQKMRLWNELSSNVASRCCPYTGEQISLERLFKPGSDVEIEHILPLSRTLDDSMANKTVAVLRANRDKGDQTPFEAFGHSPAGYEYAEILERSKAFKGRKAYRFGPDAMERYLREDADFTARALNDTAYLSRLSREYLALVLPEQNIWVVPGTLTGLLRKKLGLNGVLGHEGEKNRNDHRHHAVDAAVIGIMDRAFLQGVARDTARGRGADSGIERLVVQPPWPTYRESVERAVTSIHVSHRPDHSHETGLANSTIYGLRPDGMVAVRKPLASFESVKAIEKTAFANERIKTDLLAAVGSASTPAEVKQRVAAYSAQTGIRRVRALERLEVIPVPHPAHAEHRAPRESRSIDGATYGLKGDSNYCIEIYEDEKGKWRSEVITTYQAYSIVRESRGSVERLRHPTLTQSGRPLIMRLMKNDKVRVIDGGETVDLLVVKFSQQGTITMAPPHEGNLRQRSDDPEDNFDYTRKSAGPLRDLCARQITVSPAGRISDPGRFSAA